LVKILKLMAPFKAQIYKYRECLVIEMKDSGVIIPFKFISIIFSYGYIRDKS